MKLQHVLACCLLLSVAFLRMAPCAAQDALEVPAFTAYSEPDPEALAFSDNQPLTGWSDSRTTLAWYGLIRTKGTLNISLRLQVPAGNHSRLSVKIGDRELATKVVQGSAGSALVSFSSLQIDKPGPYRFALTGLERSGPVFGNLESLMLSGTAIKDALFNLTPQRGAPSVHLNFPLPESAQAEWFYNEITVKKDPLWSYYEACGFARGYFGIQVNSPTERRIIFSVWDSGNEAVDRSKVAPENRVQLIQKGEGVVASDFGNEGTGGHSHLVYPWKTGDTYRFLVHAKPDGAATIYTAYFYFPEKHAWGLIASFRAPKDGGYLRHLYSFNEDFSGANGQQQRLAEFGNQWVKMTDGHWLELTNARFTHTARGLYKDRLDRGAGVVGNRFFLTNGGFQPETINYNDEISRPAIGSAPEVVLSDIAKASPN